MFSESIKKPSFYHDQRVRFLGGEGIVRGLQPEAGSWTYLIEMAMGPKPNFGRIGSETMVILPETELCAA
jgi:hypothetical protein